MAAKKSGPGERVNPKTVDPDTGELVDAGELGATGERPAPSKRSGVLDHLKRAARDAAMRRVSTKR